MSKHQLQDKYFYWLFFINPGWDGWIRDGIKFYILQANVTVNILVSILGKHIGLVGSLSSFNITVNDEGNIKKPND